MLPSIEQRLALELAAKPAQVAAAVVLLDEGATYTEVAISNFDRNSGISKAFNFKNSLSVTHSLLQILFRRIRKILFYRVFKTDGIK